MPLTPVNHSLGTPFIELPSIDSTNNYALAQIHANMAQAGTCYFAHEQTSGKGQRGKSWFSEKDKNIMMSLVLRHPFLQVSQQFHLSACMAVAASTFLGKYLSDDLKIKWPNDLYWQEKKIGGILIENILGSETEKDHETSKSQSSWKWSVIGIGININQTKFPDDLKNPVSLKQITGKKFEPVALAKALCKTIEHFYDDLKKNGAEEILKLYNQALYKKNELVTFKKQNRSFDARVISITDTGQLVIQHSIEENFSFGEIEWIVSNTIKKF